MMSKLSLFSSTVGTACSAHAALPFVNNGTATGGLSFFQIGVAPELTINELIILGLVSLTALAIFLQKKLR